MSAPAAEQIALGRPLEGRTVIDMTLALAGPYATLLLAGLGARVIKVENPATGGDAARGNAPYLGADGLRLEREHDDDMSLSMLVRGRDKLSVTLNLKDERGREVLGDLIGAADVVVENFASGVMRRLGVDYEFAAERNPRIVYTSISGFGAQGGHGDKAMDSIIQALSGVMFTAGEPDDGPIRFGLPVGDLLAPVFAVVGTLSALMEADRTGRGQHVDVSMLGVLTSLVACEPFDAFAALGLPLRTGSTVPRLAPFGIFATADGHVALCAPTDRFARGVFEAIGREELAADPRFAARDGRVARADELHALIADWARTRRTNDVVAEFARCGVPSAPVRHPNEATRDPIVRAREEVVPVEHPVYGATDELMGAGLPIRFSRSPAGFTRPAPRLGEHNGQVYADLLGYSEERVAELAQAGVI